MRQLSFKRHRFPVDIIRHSVWLYAGFILSCRDVEEMLAKRGLDISYENTFHHQRHLLNRPMLKEIRTESFNAWKAASVAA